MMGTPIPLSSNTQTTTKAGRAPRYGVTEPVSLNPPSPEDIRLTDLLTTYLRDSGFFEPEEEAEMREAVLGRLNVAVRGFVREVARRRGLPPELANSCTSKIFTFGSYRLGVHSRGADIDTLCVAPQHVTRDDFFTVLPEMLGKSLSGLSSVTLVPDAYVPVMKLQVDGICMDLVFARVPGETSISESFDLLNNRMLGTLEEKCVLSVNGSRTTDEILRLVPSVETFHSALRAVKLWAKRRALYGNSYGYLNGVACAIMTARICQLYPNASASLIVSRFFAIYQSWAWPNPVYLKPIDDHPGLGMRVWSPRLNPADRHHRMPILTPAYPSMCSTHNVSDSTLRVILSEFGRGMDICKRLYRLSLSSSTSLDNPTIASNVWDELFQPSDFFIRQRNFFQIIAIAKGEAEHRAWAGYVESRVRHLTMYLEKEADIEMAPLFPKGFEVVHEGDDMESLLAKHFYLPNMTLSDTVDRTAGNGENDEERVDGNEKSSKKSEEQEGSKEESKKLYSTAFYVGLSVKTDPSQPRAPRRLLLDRPVNDFKTYVLGWEKLQPSNMFLIVRDVKRDNLPEYVFEDGPPRPPPRLARSASGNALAGASKKRSSEVLK